MITAKPKTLGLTLFTAGFEMDSDDKMTVALTLKQGNKVMIINLTKTEIDNLWAQGFRPYEIYVKNPEPVDYFGEWKKAGEIGGWEIKFVFAKKESLARYPFFDEIIGIDSMANPYLELWG